MIMLCGHCGNRTTIEKCGEYEATRQKYDSKNDKWYWNRASWRLIECMTCSKPTLFEVNENVSDTLDPVAELDYFHHRILYPSVEAPLTNLPQKVERAYTAALKVRNIEPNAYAVLVGRTLEAACNHEKAPGRTLANKLDYLAQSGRIPSTLAEMALHLRELRNLGAHAAEDEVNEEDVPVILDFVEAILEYLYVAPAKIEAVRARLKKGEIKGND